jgi:hypothetical protein
MTLRRNGGHTKVVLLHIGRYRPDGSRLPEARAVAAAAARPSSPVRLRPRLCDLCSSAPARPRRLPLRDAAARHRPSPSPPRMRQLGRAVRDRAPRRDVDHRLTGELLGLRLAHTAAPRATAAARQAAQQPRRCRCRLGGLRPRSRRHRHRRKLQRVPLRRSQQAQRSPVRHAIRDTGRLQARAADSARNARASACERVRAHSCVSIARAPTDHGCLQIG